MLKAPVLFPGSKCGFYVTVFQFDTLKRIMATHISQHLLPLRLVLILLVAVVQISEEVSIMPVTQPIRAKNSDVMVIIPCDFKTTSYETPQITWYQEKLGERRKIMQFDIHNRLTSYGKFENRVARGDRGALLLLSPSLPDSGNYSCEVEVDNDNPSWVKNTVTLRVSEDFISDTGSIAGPFTLISVYWLVSVLCSVLLGRDPRKVFRNGCAKQRTACVVLCLLIACAMVLIFVGVIFAATALRNSPVYDYGLVASLGSGIPGTVLFVAVAIVWPCLPETWWCAKKYRDTFHLSMSSKTEIRKEGRALLSHTTKNREVPTECAIVVSNVKTLEKPSGENITGMSSLSHGTFYCTTASSLYKMKVGKDNTERQFEFDFNNDEDVLSLGNLANELLICVRKKQDQKIDNRSYFVSWNPAHIRKEIHLDVKSTILWCQADRANRNVYTAFSDPDQVVKVDLGKRKGPAVWTSVLKKPVCIVRNSRDQFIVADDAKNDLFVFDKNDQFLSTMKVSVPKELEHKLHGCNRLAVAPDDTVFASSPLCRDVLVFGSDFRFQALLCAGASGSGEISCLLADSHSLYVAHDDGINVVPLGTGITRSRPITPS